jgi:DNA-binding IclR family transcriptional regulator
VLAQGGGWLVKDLAEAAGKTYSPTYKSLRALEEKGLVARQGRLWSLKT